MKGADGGGRRRLFAPAFTGLQFIAFVGAGLVSLAALLAAGLAIGLALAGAACVAVIVLALWIVASNLIDGERRVRRSR